MTVNKGTLTLSTAIYNAATNVAISGSQALGTSVYDTASFSGATAGFTPTIADVSYQFGASPAGSGAQSNATGALGAGSYSYSVTFAGDSNYNAITTPVVENLTINKGTLTLNTAIYNAATNVAISGSQALGTSVYDTASFSGATAGFTPTIADVSYEFGASPAGSGAQSSATGALAAGSYSYSVTFAGDSNYNAITSPVVENLTINKGTLTLNTAIYNAATNVAISGSQALGTSVYDTASFSGATAGFTPTIANVSYEFGASPAGSGAQSSTTGALSAGSYSYSVTFAGDSNYNAITTPVVENLTINKGSTSIATALSNNGMGSVGTSVYDTATITFTPSTSLNESGSVTYTLTGSELASLSSATFGWTGSGTTWTDTVSVGSNGVVPPSSSLTLPSGTDYVFSAKYTSANSNYASSGSSPHEPLTMTLLAMTPDMSPVIYCHTVEGQATNPSDVLAKFTDTAPGVNASDFSVSINWGACGGNRHGRFRIDRQRIYACGGLDGHDSGQWDHVH